MPEPDWIVISNTTPIVSLALIGKLDLLRLLYGEVWIPPAVKAELLAGGFRVGAREVGDADYLRLVTLADLRRADLLSDLDRGGSRSHRTGFGAQRSIGFDRRTIGASPRATLGIIGNRRTWRVT